MSRFKYRKDRTMLVRRITYIASAVAVAALVVSGCAAPNSGSAPQTAAKSGATIPAKPSAPVSLHILDVAGNQKLTRTMIDDFVKAHRRGRLCGDRGSRLGGRLRG